ncbi:hypothetical protein [Aminipila sp.]|uniref:hypothetical protein n=1 Tax=Aminipila sp. TaxID=2060095 RepID=UPI00289C5E7C|nr:hypothetical protein [Aminipila sp.]
MFKQKNFFEVIKYDFYDKGVMQSYTSFLSRSVVNVSFEEIGNEIIRKSTGKKAWLIASGILFCLSILLCICSFTDKTITMADSIFYLVPSIVCFIVFILLKQELVYLVGRQNLFFFYKKNQISQIHEFINEIIKRRNNYYKEKYAIIENDLTLEQQLNKFRWLKNDEIITAEEYDYLIDQLQSLANKAYMFYNQK